MRTMMLAAVAVTVGVSAAWIGAEVEAAPNTGSSVFAGDYTGQAQEPFESWQTVWGKISIASSGRITGTDPSFGSGKFSGSVASDGTYSLSGSIVWRWPHHGGFWVRGVRGGGVERDAGAAQSSAIAESYPFQSAGTLELGADGNLHGTTTSGATFVWTRR